MWGSQPKNKGAKGQTKKQKDLILKRHLQGDKPRRNRKEKNDIGFGAAIKGKERKSRKARAESKARPRGHYGGKRPGNEGGGGPV